MEAGLSSPEHHNGKAASQSHLKGCFGTKFPSANFTAYVKIFYWNVLRASSYPALKKTLLALRRYLSVISKLCSVLPNYHYFYTWKVKPFRTVRDDSYSPSHQACKPAFLNLLYRHWTKPDLNKKAQPLTQKSEIQMWHWRKHGTESSLWAAWLAAAAYLKLEYEINMKQNSGPRTNIS